jgi:hypothetical protein
MILHLLKTDWQRLKRPILGVWLLLLLTTLPWFFHRLESFQVPWIEDGSGTWNGHHTPELLRKPRMIPVDGELLRYLTAIATILLSSAVGMHGIRWQAVSPLKPSQRVAAKLLSLLVFIILPQTVLAALILQLHGFSAHVILAASAGTLLSLGLLHAATALFAHHCASLWTWLAGIAALLGAAVVVRAMLPGDFSSCLHPFTDPWAMNRGPSFWVLGGGAILALTLLPKLVRSRPGTPRATGAAVVAMLLAALAAYRTPTLAWLWTPPSIPSESLHAITAEIEPQSIRIDDDFYGSSPPGTVRVIATARTGGELPPGIFVVWSSAIATPWESRQWTRAFPNDRGPTDLAALQAILPAPLIQSGYGVTFGENNLFQTFPDSAERFQLQLAGHVFRYQQIADLPFDESTALTRDGDITVATRRFPTEQPELILEAAVQGPAHGIGRDARALSWQPQAIASYRFVLHFPEDQVCLPLQQFTEQLAPIPAGASWARRLLQPWEDMKPRRFDPRGVRLLIFKPVTLASIRHQVEVSRDAPDQSRPPEFDWTLSRNYGLDHAAYLANHRPFRPDPATCSEAEFLPYLRTVSATFASDLAERDLAEYAPRFGKPLALHSRRFTAARAIAPGTPESRRDDVLAAIRQQPDLVHGLASTLVERGWHPELRDLFVNAVARWPRHDPNRHLHREAMFRALAQLEDPSTYPALLTALRESRSFELYRTLRELPGIDEDLDEAVRDIAMNLSPAVELSRNRQGLFYGVFDPFRAPVSHGNPVALARLLELWRMLPPEIGSFDPIRAFTGMFQPEPALPETVEAWRAFIDGKTERDFTHDPLTRKWHAPSSRP